MDTALATLAAMVILSQPPAEAPRSVPTGKFARMTYCVVSIVNEVQISAEASGVLMEMDVKENARVEKDQILARIDDADPLVRLKAAELELAVAMEQADNDINVRAADAAAQVAASEYKESEYVNRRSPGTIPATQLRRERLTQTRAELQVDVARLEQSVAKLTAQVRQAQVDAAKNEIRRRKIDSPLNGVVVQIFRQPGEWVDPGDPLLRVVNMDRLRVEGFLKSSDFLPQEVAGQPVVVEVELARGRRETFTGQIEFASELVEASGEFRVWAEVENRKERGYYLLRPGLSATMTIRLSQ